MSEEKQPLRQLPDYQQPPTYSTYAAAALPPGSRPESVAIPLGTVGGQQFQPHQQPTMLVIVQQAPPSYPLGKQFDIWAFQLVLIPLRADDRLRPVRAGLFVLVSIGQIYSDLGSEFNGFLVRCGGWARSSRRARIAAT